MPAPHICGSRGSQTDPTSKSPARLLGPASKMLSQSVRGGTQEFSDRMCWSTDHTLRTTVLEERETGDKLQNLRQDTWMQKPPLKSTDPKGVHHLMKPGASTQVILQNARGRHLTWRQPGPAPVTYTVGMTQGRSTAWTSGGF